jgi:hypothetical protein
LIDDFLYQLRTTIDQLQSFALHGLKAQIWVLNDRCRDGWRKERKRNKSGDYADLGSWQKAAHSQVSRKDAVTLTRSRCD